jgi:protein-tyrosine phosphatase
LIPNETKPGWNENVPDPYWGNGGFEKVYWMLEETCEAVIKKHQ